MEELYRCDVWTLKMVNVPLDCKEMVEMLMLNDGEGETRRFGGFLLEFHCGYGGQMLNLNTFGP